MPIETGLSTYWRTKALEHFFNITPYTPPSTIYLAFCTSSPSPSATGSNLPEVSYAGYSRGACASWRITGAVATNNTSVALPPPPATGLVATHFALCDALTGGNVLAIGKLLLPYTFITGVSATFQPSTINVSVSLAGVLDTKIVEHLFNIATYAPRPTLLALSTVDPGDNGGNLTEPTANTGYLRSEVVRWVRVGDAIVNADTVLFPVATSQWDISHIAMVNDLSVPTVLAYSAMAKTVGAGKTFAVKGGDFKIYFELGQSIIDGAGGIASSSAVGTPTVSIQLPANAPIILFTDVVSGPTSGGENNNGMYLRLFGYNFGTAPDLGVTTKVFINDIEVGAYHGLRNARSQPLLQTAGIAIQEIAVQVGALTGTTPGTAYSIKVVRNGGGSNVNHKFTPQPGKMVYCSVTGSDVSGNGSITSPYRYVQNPTRTNPAWANLVPGDTIIMRGGTWNDQGWDNRFVRIRQDTNPTVPNGVLGNGYISIIGYPGEDPIINLTVAAGNYKGGISAPSSAYLTNSHYFAISSLIINDDDATKPSNVGAGGPINTQTSGEGWRIVNNELTMRIGEVAQKSAAITGAIRYGGCFGNYIHDCQGVTVNATETLVNHGFYIDNMSTDFELAYNTVINCIGGSGIQLHGNLGVNCGYPFCGLIAFNIHHNFVKNTAKYGINLSDCCESGVVVNNIVRDVVRCGIRFATTIASNIHVAHNTLYNVTTGNFATAGAIQWEPAGSVTYTGAYTAYVYNNIIYKPNNSSPYYLNYNGAGADAMVSLFNNLYFGGGASTPAKDTAPLYGDPLFVSLVSGSEDFHIQATSPAKNAGTAPLVTIDNDFFFNKRVNQLDIGAHEQG